MWYWEEKGKVWKTTALHKQYVLAKEKKKAFYSGLNLKTPNQLKLRQQILYLCWKKKKEYYSFYFFNLISESTCN